MGLNHGYVTSSDVFRFERTTIECIIVPSNLCNWIVPKPRLVPRNGLEVSSVEHFKLNIDLGF